MSKKDKKIEIQLTDAKVTVGKDSYEGYVLTIGKKVIGEIAELDSQFAIIKNGNVDIFLFILNLLPKNWGSWIRTNA